ncbi:MAG: hypothetical protein LUP91_16000, partial [Methylococcaceae bacterium]|nr:hypothetical protein [Methylococcaceae bacterium]
ATHIVECTFKEGDANLKPWLFFALGVLATCFGFGWMMLGGQVFPAFGGPKKFNSSLTNRWGAPNGLNPNA